MHAKYLLRHHCRDWQPVEAQCKLFPDLQVVLPLAFVVEPISPIDRTAFVVAPQQKEAIAVHNLVCQQKADSLDALLAPVHIVAHKEVLLGGMVLWKPNLIKQPQQVYELTMDVAEDVGWG